MSKINLYPNILSVSGTYILTASDVIKPGIPTKTVTVDQLTILVHTLINGPYLNLISPLFKKYYGR